MVTTLEVLKQETLEGFCGVYVLLQFHSLFKVAVHLEINFVIRSLLFWDVTWR
jgi:hypothetical protein